MEIALLLVVIAVGTTVTLNNVSSEDSKQNLCIGLCINSEFKKTEPMSEDGLHISPELTLDLEEKTIKVN